MVKKRYAMTLLEIMIVITIIGIIGSVIGYNMRGSLNKGKAFKTKEAISKIYEIVQVEQAMGRTLEIKEGKVSVEEMAKFLDGSGMVRKPKEFVKDGWGNDMTFLVKDNEVQPQSVKYEEYCTANGIVIEKPWED